MKKQSGGHGQYAVAYLRVAPLGRGDGFQFVDAVVGGAIPKNYIAAVNKGVEEAAATGGAHGFPVVDVRVECYDGKTHSVDSSDMAFKTAAAEGFREAVTHASPVILEPISLRHGHRADRSPGRRVERREHPPRTHRRQRRRRPRIPGDHRPRARPPSCSATRWICGR